MQRYINEPALLKAVEGYTDMTKADLLYILEDIPTADVEEVWHGEWKDVGEHYCQCSICTTMFEALPTKSSFKADNIFCRHCGAKMEEGDEG